MRFLCVLLSASLLLSFQDTTKTVLSSSKGSSINMTVIDSCDFRMDTAYAGHLYREAIKLFDSGKQEKALDNLKNIETIYSSSSKSLPRDLLLLKGKIYRSKGEYIKSQEYLNEALQTYPIETFRDSISFQIVDNLAFCNYQNESYSKAVEHYIQAVRIREDIECKSCKSLESLLSDLGMTHLRLGNYETGEKYLIRAKNVLIKKKRTDSYDYALTLNNIGYLNSITYSYQKALLYYVGAEKVVRGSEYDQLYLALLINIATSFSQIEKHHEALRYAQQALRFGINNNRVEHSYRGIIYNLIGSIYLDLANYEAAAEYFDKSLEFRINMHGQTHSAVATGYGRIGHLKKALGDYESALEHFNNSFEILCDIFGKEHDRTLDVLTQVADSQRKLKRFYRAERNLLNIYDQKRQTHGEENVQLVNPLVKMARVYFDQEKYVDAGIYIRKALKISRANKTEDPLGNYKVIKIYRSYFEKTKQLDSIHYYNNAILATIRDIQKGSSSSSSREFEASKFKAIFEVIIDDYLKYEWDDDLGLFELSEEFKGRQLIENVREEQISAHFGIPDSVLQQERDLHKYLSFYEKKLFKEKHETKSSNDSLVNLYEEKLFILRRKSDEVKRLLKTEYTKYYNARYSQKVISAKGVQNSLLQPNQALIEYFVGDSSIFTFTILPDTFYIHQIKKDFPLDIWVEDMLHGIYAPFTTGTDTLYRKYPYEKAASRIYQKVFHHADALLPQGTEIILVPDGILGYIPFDALLTDPLDADSYLIREHQISYAYSATLQAEMKNMQHGQQPRKKILAFAPSFDHSETSGDTSILASRFIDVSDTRNWLGPLKYNDDEVQSISQIVPTDLFMDSTATKEQFLQHAGDYSIIHLSTHGKANDKMGDYSFLAFYDLKDSSETWLYNRELYGLDLNADMVVLSACETGIGELQQGEGIISLARGFSYAGAKSIITTLWSVNDRSTQKIMELFYGNLSQGMHKDKALRQAKLDYLDQYPHLGKSPYFWAGIIPIGDMRPISFQTPWYQNPLFGLGGLLLLTLGIWGSRKLF